MRDSYSVRPNLITVDVSRIIRKPFCDFLINALNGISSEEKMKVFREAAPYFHNDLRIK